MRPCHFYFGAARIFPSRGCPPSPGCHKSERPWGRRKRNTAADITALLYPCITYMHSHAQPHGERNSVALSTLHWRKSSCSSIEHSSWRLLRYQSLSSPTKHPTPDGEGGDQITQPLSCHFAVSAAWPSHPHPTGDGDDVRLRLVVHHGASSFLNDYIHRKQFLRLATRYVCGWQPGMIRSSTSTGLDSGPPCPELAQSVLRADEPESAFHDKKRNMPSLASPSPRAIC